MSLNFLLFLSSLTNNGQAIPVSLTAESSPLALDTSSKRSLAGIVSGCLVTTFLCAWVAVHPNIPPDGECGWKAVWRRTKLMFWTLLAPELILAWAVNQRHAAQEIADTYNEIKGEHTLSSTLCPIHQSIRSENQRTELYRRVVGGA